MNEKMNTLPFDLQAEAAYVLGMMDMYQSDQEIAQMLLLKGLTKEQVAGVIALVRREGYEKRIRQAKRLIIVGVIVTVVAGGIWLFMKNKGVYDSNGELLERVNGRMMVEPFLYGWVAGLVQTIYGLQRFITYSAKLRKEV